VKWLRLYTDTPDDQKWRLVSVRSGEPVGNILAVWTMMLCCAGSAHERGADRGTLDGWNDEIAAAVLGYKPQIVTSIREAMQGLVLDGDKMTGWEKRQRDGSDNAAARKAKSRANKHEKTPPDGGGTGSHGTNGADPYSNDDVTLPSRDNAAMSRDIGSMSRDSHATVTGGSSRAKTPDSDKKDSVASATGAEAPEPPTILDTIYRECLTWLVKTSGTPEKTIRTRIGKWRQNWSDGTVLEAITIAQAKAREGHLSQPLTYIGGILKNRVMKNGQQANGSKHDDLANGLAGAFIDQLDPGSANFSGDGGAVARRYH
jgi:hypothetical protein